MHGEYSLLIDNLNDNLDDSNDDLFLFNIYYYYWKKGYSNIIISEILNIFVLTFSVLVMLFLFFVVNFGKLISFDSNKETEHLSNFLDWSSFKKANPFVIITFLIFGTYLTIRIINLFSMAKNFRKVRDLYRRMMISDSRLNTISWNDVVNKVIEDYKNLFLNHYNLTGRIMKKDNIMIFLHQEKENIFRKQLGGRFYEWNFIFCLLNPLFDKNHRIKKSMIQNPESYFHEVQERITRVMILNIVFMPAILIFMVFYFFLQYGEQFYNDPEMIVSRQWTIKAKWKYRSYNELSHFYYQRLEKGAKAIDEYSNQFSSKATELFSRFIVYVLGSFLLFLVVMAFLNERLLMYMDITTGKPFIWYIGVITPIVLIAKKFTNPSYLSFPKKKYTEIIKEFEFPPEWEDKSDSRHIKNQILKLYPLRIELLLKEFLGILLSPYYLWKLRGHVRELGKTIIDNLEEDTHMGYVIKDSLFKDAVQLEENPKTLKSLYRFRNNNPDFYMNEFLNIDVNQSNIQALAERINTNDLYNNQSLNNYPTQTNYYPEVTDFTESVLDGDLTSQEMSHPPNYDPFATEE